MIDTSESEVKNLFTNDEWAEICCAENKKYNVALPEEILRLLLNNMNKTTVDGMSEEIFRYADILDTKTIQKTKAFILIKYAIMRLNLYYTITKRIPTILFL
ncbi:hypothetical protein PS15m_006475 [Mucor circinelloides]